MTWNGTSCSTWRLYVIVDRAAAGSRALADVAARAVRGGADAIQLRDKTATTRSLLETAARLLAVTRPAGVPLIINDRVDVAHAAQADGVHLGQDDLPIEAARAMLGRGRLIGKSTHSLEQAAAAEEEGADYLGVGPIFPTPTKPDYGSVGLSLVRSVSAQVRIPFVCIGGIEAANVRRVAEAGGDRVAVVRAVCGAEDPEAAARTLKQLIGNPPQRRVAAPSGS
ncbi:MAG: thiamine phosphate synthase [Candidatus Omnitrophica bacterium]|nr:thiamine phosphate synthase [Candidatus Omnitrophota bacterium]